MKQDLLLTGIDRTIVIVSEDGNLQIDYDVKHFLRERNIVSARALVSFLKATPDSLVTNGIFSAEGRDKFRDNVFAALKGHLPDEVFEDRPPVKRAFGALDPRTIKKDSN